LTALSKETLEAIVRLQRTQDFEIFTAWLRAKTQELTRSALRTATPQICGAANELQDLVDKLTSARDKLAEILQSPKTARAARPTGEHR
jgi:hypothetical protein